MLLFLLFSNVLLCLMKCEKYIFYVNDLSKSGRLFFYFFLITRRKYAFTCQFTRIHIYIFFQSLKLDMNRTMALELRFLIKEVFRKERREK